MSGLLGGICSENSVHTASSAKKYPLSENHQVIINKNKKIKSDNK